MPEDKDVQTAQNQAFEAFLDVIGRKTVQIYFHSLIFLNFLGRVTFSATRWVREPHRIQWKLVLHAIETTGFNALPIIAALSFAIGIVMAYEAGIQLRYYGANLYVVDFIGISILRELGPLMAAIMVAGRSGSAITAELGIMKINEEVDALQTMGINPIERLALQNVFGLLIALPLLTIWADILGVMGGMIMSKNFLGISYYEFIIRFGHQIPLKHYLMGLGKTPVYAILIALIACYQGFQVQGSAESVGFRTTRSVVQAIFTIIIFDALFAVLYSWYEL